MFMHEAGSLIFALQGLPIFVQMLSLIDAKQECLLSLTGTPQLWSRLSVQLADKPALVLSWLGLCAKPPMRSCHSRP